MNLIKKLFVYAVVIATAFTMILPAGISVAETNLVAGDLIKSNVSPAVYYYNGTERFAFPNPTIYFSWYQDFSAVKTITATELADITYNGKLVTMRPGTKLVKIESDPKVYAVEPGGKLKWVPSEAVALALYGTNWNKMISDVSDAFWFWYDKTDTTPLTATAHPTGTLVKYANSNDIYYIDGTTKRLVTSEGFTANKFDMDYVLTIPDTITYSNGTQVTAMETELFPITSGSATTPVVGGGLTVAASASNPVSATIIADDTDTAQTMIPFVAVNLTASSEGSVKVTKMTFQRTGISSDDDVPNLYIYVGNTRYTDSGSISNKVVTFNDNDSDGIITIPAGTTQTVILRGDLKINVGQSKQIGFNLTGVTSNASVTTASYPIVGNLMVTASTDDLGFTRITSTAIPASLIEVNSNEKDFEAFKVTLSAVSQDMQLEGLRLTQIGSVSSGDLGNYRLQVGGTTLATGELNANNEIYFDLSNNPYVITKGNSKSFSLLVDIVKGSTRTFKFAIQNSADVVAKDKSYNVYTQAFKTSEYSWTPYTPENNYKILQGTLSTSKDNTSPSGTVVPNATNVKLATFKFEATGEDVKVKSFDVKLYSTDTGGDLGIQNVQVYYDGVQVGNTKTLTGSTTAVNFGFGSSMILPAGTAKLVDIYADTKDKNGTSLLNTKHIQMGIEAITDAQGVVSLESVSADAVKGNSLQLKESALSLAKNASYGDNAVTSPAIHAKIGSFTVSAGATEGITVDNIYLSGVTSGQLSNLTLEHGTTELAKKATLPSTGTTSIGMGSNLSLTAGQSKIIDIYADVKSGITSYNFTATVDADGTTIVTNTFAEATHAVLQTIHIAAGEIHIADASSKPDADIVIGSMTNLVNAFEFTALNEAMTITDIRLTSAGDAETVAAVILEYPTKTGTENKTVYLDGNYAVASGLNMYIPKNGTAILSVKVQASNILDSMTNISGKTTKINIENLASNTDPAIFAAVGETSGSPFYEVTGGALTGNTMYLRATRPTITLETLPSTILNDGTQVLSKFKISADAANAISWRKIVFTYSSSSDVSVDALTIKLYKADGSTSLNATGVSLAGATKTITLVADTEQTIAAGTSQIYELKGDISGSQENRSFSTRIGGTNAAAGSATTASYTDVAAGDEGRFVWSDRSAAPHNATSADWCDSNYVKSLPTDSQTLQR